MSEEPASAAAPADPAPADAPAEAPPPPRSLPPGFRPDPLRTGIFAAGALLALALYHFYGTDSETALGGASILRWFAIQWDWGEFGNNWIMLFVSAALVWTSRRRLAEAPVRPDWRGTAVVAFALAVHFVGYRAQLPRLSLGSVAVLLWGLAEAVWGPAVARILLFPACYALLCFLGTLLVEFTMPLRLMASGIACSLLQGVGIQAVRQGTIVHSAAGGGFQFNVADPCSGLRSLITMTALAAPYAYFTIRSNPKRLLLFALSVPLAMLANALRIFTLGIVAEWIGMALAMQLYHDLSGYIVFILSILLLVAAGSLVNRPWKGLSCVIPSKKRSRA